ncbi:MAG: ribosome assembly protein YihI (activator of Der GTPase) [Paraglaciecola sp.]|jgi:ribosome assembly protein YihI (activator of Der GTPase)
MPRKKKSRKGGLIGTPQPPKAQRKANVVDTKFKRKNFGKPAGSRNNPEQTELNPNSPKQQKDPRIGSKKPVQLLPEKTDTKIAVKPKHFSPAQELNAIEQDERLAGLIEKLDSGERLSKEDAKYTEITMQRHALLCELLGIADDQEELIEPQTSAQKSEEDLLSEFESIDINQFKE